MFAPLTLLLLTCAALAQQPGTMTPEVHPKITWQHCAKGGHCSTVHGGIVMDSNWRWIHDGHGKNCFDNNKWDPVSCPDELTCAKNCQYEGIGDYKSHHGVSTNGSSLRLNYVTNKSVGSRLYYLENEHNYASFKLMAQEFTFDVDMSTLPCGTNAALYFVSMEADGGTAKHPTNKAGAKYGTGYCDANCPRGMRFFNGKANMAKDNPGLCCGEMDIWEANSEAAAFTAHPCTHSAPTICTGDGCSGGEKGICDGWGCGFNSYQMGDKGFYGPGKIVDTKKVFTVVTQFLTSDGTAHGDLKEIRRFYVQNGHVIPNSMSKIAGVTGNSVNTEYCVTSKKVNHSPDPFTVHGGMKQMGDALKSGMVLTAALWDDAGGHMLWLDGKGAGPCPDNSGVPSEIEAKYANSYVTYSNIRVGPINSTFGHH